ncbi:nicotinate phosphoribosyltransferase [Methanonatronarchaeum sp. AMET6-2]|uniref:nicotinate phosphoribosyltransferase n=1 Tax=Methanonatronarchaeum sp. AMET6-2 TaxID=2933293 RepID=UPI0011F5876E|nr:nicotinate phosphoribosyltransferase [Methanonatronarchaeum sp. AMET6-2]RZN62539.1 MAG: nicotinate phosphoribosyltransferase [Methanonatronarchaeia archaeon]UOY10178.1 nicotinate phosphoribosyltransferase [Methanonatronarchaeum sp. AMET6-2]
MHGLYNVSKDFIKKGKATDVYLNRTEEILKKKNRNPFVVAEITASERGIFSGLEEAAHLLEDLPIDVYAMEEGSFFMEGEPVMRIEGNYLDFCRYETSLLGVLCHSTAISTKAAKIKKAARDRKVFSFGTRRQHPSISSLIERSAYLGGMDGISNTAGEEMFGIEASGTMPHSLVICFGEQEKAWSAYNEVLDESIPRIMLCDTYSDEKDEVIRAINELGSDLDAVRLDTPSSRRGNFKEIVMEIRWELDLRNREDVEIFISGGIDEEDILELRDVADGFGVGTSVSGAFPTDFGMDIVMVEGEYSAKKGKYSGRKQVYRWDDFDDVIMIERENPPEDAEPLLKKMIEDGEVVMDFSLEKARERVLSKINRMPLGMA